MTPGRVNEDRGCSWVCHKSKEESASASEEMNAQALQMKEIAHELKLIVEGSVKTPR
jgi:hypothetical protein